MESRHRLNSGEWDALIAEHAQSGLSVKRFCLQRGIKPTSFHSAQKRRKILASKACEASHGGKQARPSSLPSLLTVSRQPQASGFVALHVAEESCAAINSSEASIRVQLRSSHQLWVDSGFDAHHLGRLVALLESAS